MIRASSRPISGHLRMLPALFLKTKHQQNGLIALKQCCGQLSFMHNTTKSDGQLLQTSKCDFLPVRYMWQMLNAVANRPDYERIKEVGEERACAEWLLRNGAQIKWKGNPEYVNDYNSLPGPPYNKVIVEVNADDSSVMGIGFDHFKNVKNVTKLTLVNCYYLDDTALLSLKFLQNSLQHLKIGSCGDITNAGIEGLSALQKLETLTMWDLPAVRYKEDAYKVLTKALPKCKIDFKDLKKSK